MARKRAARGKHRVRKSVEQSLRRTFGLDDLRPGQAEVIQRVLGGRDLLAIMPTGAGKSLCYQLPALHLEGTTVIISPLIALMKDQVDKLRELGLDAVEINSTITGRKEAAVIERVETGRSEFVFTTPERMTDPEFLESLRRTAVDFVVVDEAHCISQWGHDFRPSYLAIRDALAALGEPPVLALTATATPEVVEDIRRQLGRPGMEVVNTGIYRPNLAFEVQHLTGDDEKQAELLALSERERSRPMIVYTATVRHVEEVTRFLQREGLEVVAYHGRMAAGRRKEAQDRFMSGEVPTIVATNAFGLGIDKADIRSVAHYDMPGSLEAYYQEAGRAGRDGEPARCVLLYDERDRRTQLFFMGGKYPGVEDLATVHDLLLPTMEGEEPPSLRDLHLRAGLARDRIQVVLALLKDAGVVRQRRGARYTLARRAEPETLAAMAAEWRQRAEADREKLERMQAYARSARCRWQFLHHYFDEEPRPERCGICDNCRKGLAALAEGGG